MDEQNTRGRPRKAKTSGLKVVEMPSAADIAAASPLPVEMVTVHDRVCRALEITPDKVRKQVKVSHQFKHFEGGQELVFEYLRGSDDKEVHQLLDVYDAVDFGERAALSFEEYCAAAGVSSHVMFGKLMEITVTQSEQTSAIMAAIAHPEVVQKTIEAAKMLDGHREKKMLFQASGFLPRPKGAQTNITVQQQNITAQKNDAVGSLPAFDSEIRELGERMQVIAEHKQSRLLEGK